MTPAVAVTLTMNVADPADFVSKPSSARAMKSAVATMAQVEADAVTVDLSVGSAAARRVRRLQDTWVIVDAQIEVADADAATALDTSLTALDTDNITNFIMDALTAEDVNMTDLGLEVLRMATEITGLPPADTGGMDSGSGTASGASLGCKASSVALFSAVSTWLLSHV